MTAAGLDPATLPRTDVGALGPELGARFVAIAPDDAARAFVDAARARPESAVALAMRGVLTRFVSDFDANGLLGIHSMHLLSTAGWRELLGEAPIGTLLDVGAGDGSITAALAPLASRAVATETSRAMVRRLRRRGLECHAVDLTVEALPGDPRFDLAVALNVLDRCARPLSLIARLRALLAPGGRMVLSLPLPFVPHVHVGAATVDPDELLPIDGVGFEAQARSLYERVLRPAGLVVHAFTRVPYLCRGGKQAPVIALDDAVFVLR